MKKNLFVLGLAVMLAAVVVSCKKDDEETTVKASLIKTIEFTTKDGAEKWEFTYDAVSKKVTAFDNFWAGALDKSVTYNYSVSGKLTLNRDGAFWREYDINADGYITKDYDTGDTYEYTADGYLSKVYEFWDAAKHLKYEMTIVSGNITKITTYDDDAVTVKKIKEFTYTSGKNINNIHQANATDSEWRPMGNLYGKPSKNLVDNFEYWDPRSLPIVKYKSTLAYEFDLKTRPSKVTKTLANMDTEVWDYTYYEE